MQSENSVAKTIVAVMRDVESIGKDRRNQAQGFNFRGIDDIYNELHATMAKHGLFTVPRVVAERSEDRATRSGGNAIYRILSIEFDFVNANGDKITIGPMIGEGMDSGDKASNKAHSIAHKYALLQLFMIPTEEKKDPDEETYQTVPKSYLEAKAERIAPAQEPTELQSVLTVASVEPKTTANKKTFFLVTFGDGSTATTFSSTFAEQAKSACADKRPVEVTVEPKEANGKRFYNITAIL